MALDAMRRACASDEVREMIELRRKAMRDEATRMERARDEGLQQGRRAALLEMARRMREAGDPIEKIVKVTGLAPEELDE